MELVAGCAGWVVCVHLAIKAPVCTACSRAGLLPRHGDGMCRAEGEGPKEDVVSVGTVVCARSM